MERGRHIDVPESILPSNASIQAMAVVVWWRLLRRQIDSSCAEHRMFHRAGETRDLLRKLRRTGSHYRQPGVFGGEGLWHNDSAPGVTHRLSPCCCLFCWGVHHGRNPFFTFSFAAAHKREQWQLWGSNLRPFGIAPWAAALDR